MSLYYYRYYYYKRNALEVVFGFPQAKYISKCAALPIDCQCAA